MDDQKTRRENYGEIRNSKCENGEEKIRCGSLKNLFDPKSFTAFAKKKESAPQVQTQTQVPPLPTHSITQASPLLSFKPNDILAGSGFCAGCQWYASQPGFGEDQGKLVEWCQRTVKGDETTGGGAGQVSWIFKRIRENVRVRQCPRIGEAW